MYSATWSQAISKNFLIEKGMLSLAGTCLQTWAIILSAYRFEIQYKEGVDVPHSVIFCFCEDM